MIRELDPGLEVFAGFIVGIEVGVEPFGVVGSHGTSLSAEHA